jgi:single-stranded DNA-binding protein
MFLSVGQTSPETNFSVATNEYRGGEERTEYHSIVTWERLAEICGQYLVC